ncbi:unnamed protein product [Oikopleura dioica]|uniref:Uncharacterized protein n=1 Tax=Oikopleura dioica TaxID=34765 RepID=E4XYK2_OIKDI|nr:unnamed protein product [Oikopleura dioica]
MDKNDEEGQYQQFTPSNSKSFWRPEQMVTLEEIRPPSNDSNDGDGNVNDDREIQSLNTEQALEKLNAMLQNNASDDFQPCDYSQVTVVSADGMLKQVEG